MKFIADRLRRAATGLYHGKASWLRRAAPALVLDLGIGVQVLSGIHDVYGSEACVSQLLAIVVNGDGTGDTADVGHQVLADLRRQRLLEGDVADGQPAARFQDPGY